MTDDRQGQSAGRHRSGGRRCRAENARSGERTGGGPDDDAYACSLDGALARLSNDGFEEVGCAVKPYQGVPSSRSSSKTWGYTVSVRTRVAFQSRHQGQANARRTLTCRSAAR